MTDELVVRQEYETQIRHSAHPVARTVCCRMDHFTRRPSLEATPTGGLTEAITYATLSSSKRLLNDAAFICFTDKNLFCVRFDEKIT